MCYCIFAKPKNLVLFLMTCTITMLKISTFIKAGITFFGKYISPFFTLNLKDNYKGNACSFCIVSRSLHVKKSYVI